MTNLIFSIVVALVTNVSEQIYPERDNGIVVRPSDPPQVQKIPASKTVITTICRVTNFVSGSWIEFGDRVTGMANGPTPKIVFEHGREVLSSTTEQFTEVLDRKWVKDTNEMTVLWVSNLLYRYLSEPISKP